LGELDLLGGLRVTRLIKIEETEGYNPGIANDFAKNGMILQLAVGRLVSDRLNVRLSWDYSLITALANSSIYNPFYPTGVYHNGVGVTALVRLGH
jgi:hypothetical protein